MTVRIEWSLAHWPQGIGHISNPTDTRTPRSHQSAFDAVHLHAWTHIPSRAMQRRGSSTCHPAWNSMCHPAQDAAAVRVAHLPHSIARMCLWACHSFSFRGSQCSRRPSISPDFSSCSLGISLRLHMSNRIFGCRNLLFCLFNKYLLLSAYATEALWSQSL